MISSSDSSKSADANTTAESEAAALKEAIAKIDAKIEGIKQRLENHTGTRKDNDQYGTCDQLRKEKLLLLEEKLLLLERQNLLLGKQQPQGMLCMSCRGIVLLFVTNDPLI